jgi:signal transduction histidine kinase
MTILLFFLMIASITLFIAKARNPSAYWMALVLLGWFLSMSGLILFLAKYGGFYYKVNFVLFFNDEIRNLLLHSPISIEFISRMITIGRSVFIYALIGLSLALFYSRPVHRLWKIYALNTILPVLNIIFYDPAVYKWALALLERHETYIIGWVTRGWLILSALASLALLLMKYRRITIPWFKKQLQHILLGIFALVLFYFYLGFMGPLQVTDVRTYYVLYSDFSNFNPPLTLAEWYLSIGFTGILSIVSIVSIWKYTGVEKKLGQSDLQLKRKLNTANMGARVFTHAIKNQLLMLQLLLRQTSEHVHSVPAADKDEQITEGLAKSTEIVEETLKRLDQLYRSFKTAYLKLKPIPGNELLRLALDKVQIIPDNIQVSTVFTSHDVIVLADPVHLSEALVNIVTNAIEAIGKENPVGKVRLSAYIEDQWLVFCIEDNGPGIPADQQELIFDPFYTNKNTTKNWGVGLSYSKQVVSGHFGHIHVESSPNRGTSFRIMLPVYAQEEEGEQHD